MEFSLKLAMPHAIHVYEGKKKVSFDMLKFSKDETFEGECT